MPCCPHCDGTEMVPVNRGNDRECPLCGYGEPHAASSSQSSVTTE